jgi:hypothetical protein
MDATRACAGAGRAVRAGMAWLAGVTLMKKRVEFDGNCSVCILPFVSRDDSQRRRMYPFVSCARPIYTVEHLNCSVCILPFVSYIYGRASYPIYTREHLSSDYVLKSKIEALPNTEATLLHPGTPHIYGRDLSSDYVWKSETEALPEHRSNSAASRDSPSSTIAHRGELLEGRCLRNRSLYVISIRRSVRAIWFLWSVRATAWYDDNSRLSATIMLLRWRHGWSIGFIKRRC